ncbi:MAG: protein kinase domain-containing protein [Pyrinomonadaceae bacterium]
MLTPDTVLQSRYRIVRQLGEGGMGAVYEAVDERLDSTVALKETFFTDERLRKQFEREARLLARMHHPALPRVSDHFSEGDGQFLIMQFIAGDDLYEMITRKNGPFPTDQVLTWADQLLDALDYLHTQDPQIIHRDIKPQNLKLTARGQIILLDFGLAKGQIGEFSRVSTSASIFGYTPNYAPLEQIQGLGTDPRSDIYALGATLYHLMTGVKPPDALTRAAALVNSQPDPLARANEANPAVSAGLAKVLARAMAQNRDQRYLTAADMTKALHTIGEATSSFEKTEAQTILVAPTQIAASAGLTLPVVKKPTILTGESTVVRSPKAKPGRASWAIAAAVVLLLAAGVFYAYQKRNTVSPPSPSPTPINNVEVQVSPEPAATPLMSGRSLEESKAQTALRPSEIRKKESPTRNKATTPTKQPVIVDEFRVPEVEVPEVRTEDFPNAARPGTHPPLTPRRPERIGRDAIRLEDGTVLRTTPDGRRVVITPDGTRRVIPPRMRQQRRRP